ncbi:hypothetical protein GH714_005546 [Hevea brasiliensis]|uniref:Uncharacterized protein n=1 Tax=Hevea brasiliensis TaxID=3981 RepID=A0A6A6N1K5_HEVBR|nr:hypothetical protein GH714_005546 [Hevea brasiliensis]
MVFVEVSEMWDDLEGIDDNIFEKEKGHMEAESEHNNNEKETQRGIVQQIQKVKTWAKTSMEKTDQNIMRRQLEMMTYIALAMDMYNRMDVI